MRLESAPTARLRLLSRAQVTKADGSAGGLTQYQEHTFTARLVDADGLVTSLPAADVDAATGAISIPIPSTVSAANVVVEASIDPLRTQHSTLAPVTTRQDVATVLPAQFPSITSPLPVTLGALEGSQGTATGEIEVAGPTAGGKGTVCVSDDPTVTNDAGHRPAESWRWTYDQCVDVEQGATAKIAISVANDVAADSRVHASAPVTFTSAAGETLTQEVPVEFTSTHPVNAVAVGLLALLLLALGILLPLIALWLLNWWTTRLDIDNGIQRARFAVRIGPGGVAFTDAPTAEAALADRFQYRPPQRNVRSIDDPDLGRLAAHVPWFPLAEPTYRITPRPGTSIVGARTSARAASAGARRADGSMDFRQLPLDAFWAIAVNNADLARPPAERGLRPRDRRALPPRRPRRRGASTTAASTTCSRDSGAPAWVTVDTLRPRARGEASPSPRTRRGPQRRATAPPRAAAFPPRPVSPPRPGTPPPRPSGAPRPPQLPTPTPPRRRRYPASAARPLRPPNPSAPRSLTATLRPRSRERPPRHESETTCSHRSSSSESAAPAVRRCAASSTSSSSSSSRSGGRAASPPPGSSCTSTRRPPRTASTTPPFLPHQEYRGLVSTGACYHTIYRSIESGSHRQRRGAPRHPTAASKPRPGQGRCHERRRPIPRGRTRGALAAARDIVTAARGAFARLNDAAAMGELQTLGQLLRARTRVAMEIPR